MPYHPQLNFTGVPVVTAARTAANAGALRSALAWLILPPFSVCFLAFSGPPKPKTAPLKVYAARTLKRRRCNHATL